MISIFVVALAAEITGLWVHAAPATAKASPTPIPEAELLNNLDFFSNLELLENYDSLQLEDHL